MVVAKEEKLVYDIKISSVVPGKIAGENKSQELKPMDLAMKLHYLKGLYFFPTNKKDGSNDPNLISIEELKRPMFEWLVPYFMTCGRIRMTPDPEPRPVIKLNDAGIRIIEARSDKTLHEWLAMEGFLSLQDQLVYGHALGPDLGFSPFVFIQVTWFKCGGISVGLSWAHILGDVFSASTFMNMLGQHLQGNGAQILVIPDHPKPKYPFPSAAQQEPCSLKRVDPVGDHWVAATSNYKMVTHHFSLSSTQLDQLLSKVYTLKPNEQRMGKCFEVLSAVMWKTIAKIRKDLDPKVATICQPTSLINSKQVMIPHNGQAISTVKVHTSASSIALLELVSLITKNKIVENNMVEETVEKDKGKFDYVVYGANLTFVDMEDANIYGFKVEGQRPMFAGYTIGGVGEEGLVLVLPAAEDGKTVIVTLPEYEHEAVRAELTKEWCIV